MMGGVTDDLREAAVRPGHPESPVILHVPHASRVIPPEVRSGLLLDDEELAVELDQMTDTDTDVIAELAAGVAATRPWLFVNPYSRLVVDPERFPDESEVMLAGGMGPVYTRTSTGRRLRDSADPALRERYYEPYGVALAELVDERLERLGDVIIIDVHSYPSRRLPYERGGIARPAICVGTDDWHTPGWLGAVAIDAFFACREIAENTPFAGCYVPIKHYTVDARVEGVMVEIRRDTYLVEPGEVAGRSWVGVRVVADCLAGLIDACTHRRTA